MSTSAHNSVRAVDAVVEELGQRVLRFGLIRQAQMTYHSSWYVPSMRVVPAAYYLMHVSRR